MKKNILPILVAVLILLFSQPVFADWTFDTLPSDGNIAGSPGETIGWGYSITNDDANLWLVITGISAGSFDFGTPDDSIFYDPDFPIVAPSGTASATYNGTMGLYQLTWDATAPVGRVNMGTFTLTAEYWGGDPYNGGNKVDLAPDQTAGYSARVVSSVPEPATMLLLGLGLVGLVGVRKRR